MLSAWPPGVHVGWRLGLKWVGRPEERPDGTMDAWATLNLLGRMVRNNSPAARHKFARFCRRLVVVGGSDMAAFVPAVEFVMDP